MNDVMYSTILFTSSAVDTEFTGLHVTPQDEVRCVYIVTTSHNYATVHVTIVHATVCLIPWRNDMRS